MRVCGVKAVAEPKRCQAIMPIPITIMTGIHMASAPRLCSHLPTSRPMTFSHVTTASAMSENAI